MPISIGYQISLHTKQVGTAVGEGAGHEGAIF